MIKFVSIYCEGVWEMLPFADKGGIPHWNYHKNYNNKKSDNLYEGTDEKLYFYTT